MRHGIMAGLLDPAALAADAGRPPALSGQAGRDEEALAALGAVLAGGNVPAGRCATWIWAGSMPPCPCPDSNLARAVRFRPSRTCPADG
jgi:hypothetical protein